MKDFLKMTLAVIVGLIIVSIISTVITLGIIGVAAAAGKTTTPVLKESVLKIDLSKVQLGEQSQETNPFDKIQSKSSVDVVGILDAVQAINAAAEDPMIKFIYLKPDGNVSDLAHLQEFRTALVNFRNSGKAVISYMEAPGTGSYYIASVSDKVFMTSHPGATTTLTGISSQMVFLKDLLDRLGVNVQLIRHGKYKSAGEMYVRNSPSAENLEQYQVMINSMWGNVAADIAASRGISVEELNACINGLKLNLPEDFTECKLADELLTAEELKDKLATFACKDKFKDINMVGFKEYIDSRSSNVSKAKEKIAIIYADGEIVGGKDNKEIAGDRFASIISNVRADSTVKVVVLRVNSPGGSVIASDKIKVELDLLKAEKPLIASYGSYAASGGYWISNNCDRIFSDATTLTGSIGVFSMIPDLSKTLKNIAHVNVTTVSSNDHGDMYSLTRPLSAPELAYQLRSVEDIYDRFTTMVSEGRGLDKEYVDGIGQGRVWTGSDALGIGLVDELGTLEDALKYAASCGGDENLDNWKVEGYPKPQTTMEMLMDIFNPSSSAGIMEGTALEGVSRTMLKWVDMAGKGRAEFNFARLPYEMEIR